MLRSNAYCGEIRESALLPLSDSTINPKKTRCRERNVFEKFGESARFVFSSRKIKSSGKSIFSRCWVGKFEIFFKIFGNDSMHESASTSNSANNAVGSWCNFRKLDQKQKRMSWVKALSILVATGIILLIPVLVVLIGIILPLTPTTTMVCAVPVTTFFNSNFVTTSWVGSIIKWWSANFILLRETQLEVQFSV